MTSPRDGMASPSPDAVGVITSPPESAAASGSQSGEAGPDNPFSCNVCKRSYTRVDHLARHYRSHTHEKPFVCEICSKSFARVDLLKRHRLNHDDVPSSKQQDTSQKGVSSRASQACIACAEAKLRCEGSNPCVRCLNKAILCQYAQPRSRKSAQFLPNSHTTSRHSRPSNAAKQHRAVPLDQTDISALARANRSPEMAMNHAQYSAGQGNVSGQNTSEDQVMLDTQLPTPTTFDPGSAITPFDTSYYASNSAMTFDDLPMIDFLRDQGGSDDLQLFPKDVLDFNIDTTFDFPDMYGLPGVFPDVQQNPSYPVVRLDGGEQSGNRSGYTTPGVRRSISLGTQAFKESTWLWTPAAADHGYAEQCNLSLPSENLSSETADIDVMFPLERLSQGARDGVLGMVLSTCEKSIYPRVVACFPSAELLTNLLHSFMNFHVRQEISWIHPATLNINEESPEFLGSLVSSGAALSRVPELRKLGFAIQEAVRLYLPKMFENDNRYTRRLRPLQAYVLYLDVALWSGDRRKMEIAESFAYPLLTMVRRAGHFRRSRSPETTPLHNDDVQTVERKWQNWVQAESFKRLALVLFARDTRSSMSLLNQPLISYAELSTDLPLSKDLWLARTSAEWKNTYLSMFIETTERLPSIRTCVDDISPMLKHLHYVDIQMTLIVIVSCLWRLIWQYREMKSTIESTTKPGSRTSDLSAKSLHQEISQAMQHLSLNTTEWDGGMKPAARLLYEQCLMHLHVSLEEVQLLAGKQGEEEARKVFPILVAWAESPEARLAIFHAGQVLRAAKEHAGHMLRDASAVAVYHAGLTFWAYSVLSKSTPHLEQHSHRPRSSSMQPYFESDRVVLVDGEDSPVIQRFLVLGKGTPSIRRWVEGEEINAGHNVSLSDPVNMMSAITNLLWKKTGDDERKCPPLVMNLSRLMSSLGNAAAGMRRK